MHFPTAPSGVPAAKVHSAAVTHCPYNSTMPEAASHFKHHGESEENSNFCAAVGYSHSEQNAPHKQGLPPAVSPFVHKEGAPGNASTLDVDVVGIGGAFDGRVGGNVGGRVGGCVWGASVADSVGCCVTTGAPVHRLLNLPLPVGSPPASMQSLSPTQLPVAKRYCPFLHLMHVAGRLGPGPTRCTCLHVWQSAKHVQVPATSPAVNNLPVHTPATAVVATGSGSPASPPALASCVPPPSSLLLFVPPAIAADDPGGWHMRPNRPRPVGIPPVLTQTEFFTQRPSSKNCMFLHLVQPPTVLATAAGSPTVG